MYPREGSKLNVIASSNPNKKVITHNFPYSEENVQQVSKWSIYAFLSHQNVFGRCRTIIYSDQSTIPPYCPFSTFWDHASTLNAKC